MTTSLELLIYDFLCYEIDRLLALQLALFFDNGKESL